MPVCKIFCAGIMIYAQATRLQEMIKALWKKKLGVVCVGVDIDATQRKGGSPP